MIPRAFLFFLDNFFEESLGLLWEMFGVTVGAFILFFGARMKASFPFFAISSGA